MVTCPNCHHAELPGALFCSQCGALLEGTARRTTQKVQQTTGQLASELSSAPPVPDIELQTQVTLYVLDTAQTIPLDGREEYTLGRSAEGQPISPNIDLVPFKGYELGVSRLHALVRLEGKKVTVMDLGSVNGTRLNGQKIQPHRPYVVTHGDSLVLGKLKLQVLIRSSAPASK